MRRTAKKALCLLLTAVMALGLMGGAAAWDYWDPPQWETKEQEIKVAITPNSIVEGLAAYINISAEILNGNNEEMTAYLMTKDGTLMYPTKLVDGQARMYVEKAPDSGWSLSMGSDRRPRILVKSESGAEGVAYLYVHPYSQYIWTADFAYVGNVAGLQFYAAFKAGAVYMDGVKVPFSYAYDYSPNRYYLTIDTDVPIANHEFVIDKVSLYDLFPSYTFTYKVKVTADEMENLLTGRNYAYIRTHVLSEEYGQHQVRVYSAADASGKIYTVHPASAGYGKTSGDDAFSKTGDLEGQIRHYSIVDGFLLLGSRLTNADTSAENTTLKGYNGDNILYSPDATYTYSLVRDSVFFFINPADGSVEVAAGKPAAFEAQNVDSYKFWGTGRNSATYEALKLGLVKKTGGLNFKYDYAHFYVWGSGHPMVTSAISGTFEAYNGSTLTTYTITSKTKYNHGSMDALKLQTNNKLLRLTTENGELINIADAGATPDADFKITENGLSVDAKFDQGFDNENPINKYSYFVLDNTNYNFASATSKLDTAQKIGTTTDYVAGAYQVVVAEAKDGAISIVTTTATGANIIYWQEVHPSTSIYMVNKDAPSRYNLTKVEVSGVDLDIDDVTYTHYMVWDAENARPSAIYITYQEN